MRRLVSTGLAIVALLPVSQIDVVPPSAARHPTGGLATSRATPAHPFPQHTTYAEGSISVSAHPQAEQDRDVALAYRSWKRRYIVRTRHIVAGERLYRVAFGPPGTAKHRVTVSEGQGFGMVIVAHMPGLDPAAHRIFDGLWRFTRAHPSHGDRRLMAWRVPGGWDSAFDGDCDMAYALLMADAQWGSTGRIDYAQAARRLLAGVLASTIGPESRLPMLGDWTSADGRRFNQYTPRSSDFMVGHFRAFARFTGNPVWEEVAARTEQWVAFLQALHPSTGLLPDFIVPSSRTDHAPVPAPPGFLEGRDDGHYAWNAGRDPWRLGTDALLDGSGTTAAEAALISRWAEGATKGRPRRFRAGYLLTGRPRPDSDYFSSFFVAPLGVAAMSDPSQQSWLDAVYNAVRRRREDYYADSVTLLCLLVMTHNFWDPTLTKEPAVSVRPTG